MITVKASQVKSIKNIIKMMEEPSRTSVTLGRSDIVVVLPILKKAIGE